jgi:hypothetical protein
MHFLLAFGIGTDTREPEEIDELVDITFLVLLEVGGDFFKIGHEHLRAGVNTGANVASTLKRATGDRAL